MLGVAILPANIQDRDGCLPVLKEVRRLFPFLQRIVADGGYQGANTAAAVRQAAGAPLEIVKRPDAAKGFVTLPKRWIVERTFVREYVEVLQRPELTSRFSTSSRCE